MRSLVIRIAIKVAALGSSRFCRSYPVNGGAALLIPRLQSSARKKAHSNKPARSHKPGNRAQDGGIWLAGDSPPRALTARPAMSLAEARARHAAGWRPRGLGDRRMRAKRAACEGARGAWDARRGRRVLCVSARLAQPHWSLSWGPAWGGARPASGALWHLGRQRQPQRSGRLECTCPYTRDGAATTALAAGRYQSRLGLLRSGTLLDIFRRPRPLP